MSAQHHESRASDFFWGDPEGGRKLSRFLGDMAQTALIEYLD